MVALAYKLGGRWKEAEELEVHLMKTGKRVLGQEHPETLTSMTNLASTYRNQRLWMEAEELEVQVIETSHEERCWQITLAFLASTNRTKFGGESILLGACRYHFDIFAQDISA
jgi:hypothetical protein